METHSRAMVLGIWEGLLVCYLVESSKRGSSTYDGSKDTEYWGNVLGTGLAFGVGGRILLDYTTAGDVEVLARGVVGMTVGVLVAEFAKHALNLYAEEPVVSDLKRNTGRRRITTRHDEEILEGNVPPEAAKLLLPPIDTSSHTHHTRTRPRVETTTTFEPITRVPILSAGVTRDLLRAGKRDIKDEEEESEQSLERDVSTADGQRRRLQEEREWARAKGDAARQAELDAEIKRYKALSAELEMRLRKRRSTYSIASSKAGSSKNGNGILSGNGNGILKGNTIILVRDEMRDPTSRTPQLVHLIPEPASKKEKVEENVATSSVPSPSRVRVIPTRATSDPSMPKSISNPPTPAPVPAPVPAPAPAPPTESSPSPSPPRHVRRTNLPEFDAPPPPTPRQPQPQPPVPVTPTPNNPTYTAQIVEEPEPISTSAHYHHLRTPVTPHTRRRRKRSGGTASASAPAVPIQESRPPSSQVPPSPPAPVVPAAPAPAPPTTSAAPPPPTAPPAAPPAEKSRPPRPLPTPPKTPNEPSPPPVDPTLLHRILAVAPARHRKPIPLTFIDRRRYPSTSTLRPSPTTPTRTPRGAQVPIFEGPPPRSPGESSAPESSDEWSRALD